MGFSGIFIILSVSQILACAFPCSLMTSHLWHSMEKESVLVVAMWLAAGTEDVW